MSNTRHAPPGASLRQNRFASSAELERGLLGNLVALRCSTLESREERELVWALQRISWTIGFEQFITGFLAGYDDRLGSRSMRKFGVNLSKHYCAEKVQAVRREVHCDVDEFLLHGECGQCATTADFLDDWDDDRDSDWLLKQREAKRAQAALRPKSYPVSAFWERCQSGARQLESHLKELCLDPAQTLECGPWYFHELISCLREYLKAWAEQQTKSFRDGFAHTALSRAIWREIDDAYAMGGTVLLHNSSGNGKSHAAEALCASQPGRARYVKAPATNDDTGFLRAIAAPLGVAAGLSNKAINLRERILPVLLTGDIVLVIDSAQWLFPVTDYRYSLPNRINWVLSELSEQGVPIVMIADSKLFDTFGLVEARTGWNRAKFVNQLSRVVELPAALTKEDVQVVAAALLPDADRAAQCKLADYMIMSQGYLHAGKPAAQRARQIAAAQKRDRVSLADMTEAIDSWMVPGLKDMNAALKRADGAAATCKTKARNSWRPDSADQFAAKGGKRRNPMLTSSDLTSSDLKRASAAAPTASGQRAGTRSTDLLQDGCNRPEETEFAHSRRTRVPSENLSADLVPA